MQLGVERRGFASEGLTPSPLNKKKEKETKMKGKTSIVTEEMKDMNQIKNCHICKADLRYTKLPIHRVNGLWYCDEHYNKCA